MQTRGCRKGHSLIELLIVLVVLTLLVGGAAMLFAGRGDGKKPAAATPRGRARTIACRSNLNQLSMALQMAAQLSERPPQSLEEARQSGATDELLRCPETKQPYRYDPRAATIICDTPLHDDVQLNIATGG